MGKNYSNESFHTAAYDQRPLRNQEYAVFTDNRKNYLHSSSLSWWIIKLIPSRIG